MPSDLPADLSLLAEPLRVRVLWLLAREELGVGELVRILQLPQSTVSRHLKDLRVAGWIRRRSEGTSGWFRFDGAALDAPRARLWELVEADWGASRTAAEDQVRLAAVIEARSADAETFFGRMRGEWDALRREMFGEAYLSPTLLALLPPDLVVADLGCGTGEALLILAPWVRRVIGIDREPAMVEAAAARTASLGNVEIRAGSLYEPPLTCGEADVLLCMLVLHHLGDTARFFEAARRVLGANPGRGAGRLVVLDMVAHDREEYRSTMGHAHLGFDPAELAEIAAEAGLVSERVIPLPPASGASGPPLFVATFTIAPG